MKNLRQKITKYSRILSWILFSIITIALLYIILPDEPKFKYEYIKGSPWKHEDLVAPFDFAIEKPAKQLDSEINEIKESFPPYYLMDTSVANNQILRFSNELELIIDSAYQNKNLIISELTTSLEEIYQTGILQLAVGSYEELNGKNEISIIKGNVSTRAPIQEILSERTAYNTFLTKYETLATDFPEINNFLNFIDFSEYIEANLSPDNNTTEKQLNEAIGKISPTLGMVQAGERIILNGEIIDDNKFLILESLKNSYEKSRGTDINKYLFSGGKMILILIYLSLVSIYLSFYRKDILNHFRKLLFVDFLILFMVFISIYANNYEGVHIYLVPIAILPILIRTFFDSRTAIYISLITILLIGFYAPNNYEYVLLQMIAGIVSVLSLAKMHRRSHLVMASVWVLISYIITYFAINFITESSFENINYRMLLWFAGSSFLIFLINNLIYVFEKIFGFISDVTLLELSDTNHPLLRRLANEAPGTFQHSMQIANLAEEVILKIGGNPFLARAGALYHDVGKLAKADFFIENQFGIENPHNKLSFEKSAEIIVSHVKNGIKLAKKYKLPDVLTEFIATHHGTTKAKYFYLKKQQENSGKTIDETKFMYPGPIPRSKEAAVVMLVDGIEAASRSLKDKTQENLKELIHKMIDQKVTEHQLDNSELTFNDINNIKSIILEKILNIYHVRIEYPKEEE